MEYSIQKLSKSKIEIAVNIEKEEWEKYIKDTYEKNKFKYSVEGFRKGKVPMSVLINRYGKSFFFEDALDDAMDKAYGEVIEKENLHVIASPDVDLKSLGEDGTKFVITVIVKPEFELGQYKGLTFEKEQVTVSDEEVTAEMDRVRESRARMVEKDTPAENGDTVIIDYSGSIDGVKFDGGTAEKQSLELGSGTFIPGFEDQVVGMKKEEQKDIEVTFPEDYGSKDLAGKKAVFAITVHEVQKKELPELDDEFVKDIDDELNTVDEWKEKIKAQILDTKAKNAEVKLENAIVEKVAENTEIEIPEAMIEEELDYRIQDFENNLKQYGLKMNDYLKYTNSSVEKMKEEQRDEAVRNVKIRLVLEEICKKENLTVTPEEIQSKIQGIDEKQMQQAVNYYANKLLTDKLLTFLKENNDIK
ncbi:MAG: trigger factor [Clostridia bacterium]|nr:trigger factor [Clostridia bacterium]